MSQHVQMATPAVPLRLQHVMLQLNQFNAKTAKLFTSLENTAFILHTKIKRTVSGMGLFEQLKKN